MQVDGKFADAVLGDFRPDSERFVVAVEGKGPKDPLDRPHAGRKMSAVHQGYRYAINLPVRLGHRHLDARDPALSQGVGPVHFRAVRHPRDGGRRGATPAVRLPPGADRVVPESGPCHLSELLHASEKVGKDLTREYYVKYAYCPEDRAFISPTYPTAVHSRIAHDQWLSP